MPDPQLRRQARQHLADRMIIEYAGAVPAGQVLAAVVRVGLLLDRYPPGRARGASLCEELVRHRLAERTARPPAPRMGCAAP